MKAGLDVASISLMAPAVRLDVFDEALGAEIAKRRIPVLIAHLTDAAEQADSTCSPYGHSLLYLVSRAFEEHEETALLGMERHLTAAVPTHAWGEHVRRLRTPGEVGVDGLTGTSATTHGGVDDDEVVRAAVMGFVHAAARRTTATASVPVTAGERSITVQRRARAPAKSARASTPASAARSNRKTAAPRPPGRASERGKGRHRAPPSATRH